MSDLLERNAVKALRQFFFDERLFTCHADIYTDDGRDEAAKLVIKWLDEQGLKIVRR